MPICLIPILSARQISCLLLSALDISSFSPQPCRDLSIDFIECSWYMSVLKMKSAFFGIKLKDFVAYTTEIYLVTLLSNKNMHSHLLPKEYYCLEAPKHLQHLLWENENLLTCQFWPESHLRYQCSMAQVWVISSFKSSGGCWFCDLTNNWSAMLPCCLYSIPLFLDVFSFADLFMSLNVFKCICFTGSKNGLLFSRRSLIKSFLL